MSARDALALLVAVFVFNALLAMTPDRTRPILNVIAATLVSAMLAYVLTPIGWKP